MHSGILHRARMPRLSALAIASALWAFGAAAQQAPSEPLPGWDAPLGGTTDLPGRGSIDEESAQEPREPLPGWDSPPASPPAGTGSGPIENQAPREAVPPFDTPSPEEPPAGEAGPPLR